MTLIDLSLKADPPNFSKPEFRAALGMFATGVTIVTARSAEGEFVGLTAASGVVESVKGGSVHARFQHGFALRHQYPERRPTSAGHALCLQGR